MRKSTWIWTACSLLAIGVIGTLAGLTSGFSDWSFGSRETAKTTEPRRLNEVTIDFSDGLAGTYGGLKFDGDVTELNSLTDSEEDVFSGFVWTRTHTKVVYRASDIGSEGSSMILGYGEGATYGYIGLELSEGFVFDGCEVVGRSYGGTDGGVSVNGSDARMFEEGSTDWETATFSFGSTQDCLMVDSTNRIEIERISIWVSEKTNDEEEDEA